MKEPEQIPDGDAEPFSDGVHLLNWPADENIDGLTVTVHSLDIDDGLSNKDDPERFTEVAAWYLGEAHGTPTTTGENFTVVALTELSRSVEVWGRKVEATPKETIELDASRDLDRGKMKRLLQNGIRLAIPEDTYECESLSEVVRYAPVITSGDNQFGLRPTFDLTVDVSPDGRPLLHVEAGHTIRTQRLLSDSYEPGDLLDVKVAHDTRHYDNDSYGTAVEWTDQRYTDYDPSIGESIADHHEGVCEEEFRQHLIGENPQLVTVDYGGFKGSQAPQLLRLQTREEEVKAANHDFYSRYQSKKRLLPEDRVAYVQSFLSDLGRVPILDLSFPVEDGPTDTGYQQLQIRETGHRLLFGDEEIGRAPSAGIKEHGVYESPGEYVLGVLAPERYTDLGEELLGYFVKGLVDIDAPGETRLRTYELGPTENYTEVGTSFRDEIDCALVLVPDDGQLDDFPGVNDPYSELKRVLMRGDVASQMIEQSTAEELTNLSAGVGNEKLMNIASAVVAKSGGTPWQIDDLPGDSDAFLGLDVSYDHQTEQHTGASASVVLADGTTYAAESTVSQQGEKFDPDHIQQFIRDLIHEQAELNGTSIDHLTIVRDGKVNEDTEAIKSGITLPDTELDIVGVRKTGQPRIIEYNDHTDQLGLADKGVAFVDPERDRSILLPWGPPDTDLDRSRGTPRTLAVRHESGPSDIATVTKQMYWLSEVHVGSPARSSRVPVPIEYADMAAEYANEGYVSHGTIIKGPAYL